jgi:protein-L-isoaspartate(D-aspartate) O-methyltransferase
MCTFMPLRGIADDARTIIPLTEDGQVTLHTYREQLADTTALARALNYPPAEAFTGVTFGSGESFEQLDLYLTCILPSGISRMPASGPAVESGKLRPQFPWGAMAAVYADTIAYLTLQPKENGDGEKFFEVGVIGHGPVGGELATSMADHIRTWDSEIRGVSPAIRFAQGKARKTLDGQFTIDKPDSRIAVDWS